ncbi:hypothetical protein ACOIEU_002544 [Cronobacter sakazakii]|uniref:hypothetical protein n=1 Tax=Cronobacter sakazakii TaxID=28141 RepID=UPI000A11164A|nr:hypothetical protein [Cronobacter sakazakii]HAV6907432.1 hypothetical protein [Cronobacter sakazakii]
MKKNTQKGERFSVGEVWQSPRGYLYRVIEVIGSQAVMRLWIEASGRKVRRNVDAISGWSIYKDEAGNEETNV